MIKTERQPDIVANSSPFPTLEIWYTGNWKDTHTHINCGGQCTLFHY